ncbi:MAG TPA: phosphatidate cytidylyltransferase, partial [Polyangiaceae bacterium]|nr:phosphatidate cytidylyltransferase [Polyangiaceae bacterium]
MIPGWPLVSSPARSNLATRVLTAAVVAPLLLVLLFLGPVWGWTALIVVATGLSGLEFFRMTHPNDALAQVAGIAATLGVSFVLLAFGDEPRALLALLAALPIFSILLALLRLGDISTAAARMAGTTFGPLWIGLLTLLTLLRREQGPSGPGYVLLAITFAWGADTGGYFAGRFLGRRKLYEAVSPKKTVAGLWGALGGATIGALVAHFWYLPALALVDGVALAVVSGLLGQLGDLGESLLKRSTGVKDS